MPELPDVEIFKNELHQQVVQQKIQEIGNLNAQMFEYSRLKLESLKGAHLKAVRRYGKYCFLHSDHKGILVFHFGMTGSVQYLQTISQPEHIQFSLLLSNGYHLIYRSIRKLGKIFLITDKKQFIQKKQLGPDALFVSLDHFLSIIKSKKSLIKTALMNQKTIAGLGNIYSDEILYQSSIHPKRKTNKLTDQEIERLYKQMRSVLHLTIKQKANPSLLPSSFLIQRRKPGCECGLGRGTIQREVIGGRATYFCDRHQK